MVGIANQNISQNHKIVHLQLQFRVYTVCANLIRRSLRNNGEISGVLIEPVRDLEMMHD